MSEPIVSGLPYPVLTVNGQPPTAISDFDGVVSLVVGFSGGVQMFLTGSANADGESARFSEKGGTAGGKDVRVWAVRAVTDGFVVEHSPSY
jgi:hypothetical protein